MSSDHFSVRVVVVALAVSTLGGLGVIAALAVMEQPIPDQLDRLVTLLAGALIGILARTSSSPERVEVANDPSNPVPVEEG